MSIAALAAAAVYFSLPSRRGSNFLFSVAARQRQIFSRDGHLCYMMITNVVNVPYVFSARY
jgi:hypothetical protein